MNIEAPPPPPKILYFSSSKNIGFTYHFSELAYKIGKCKNFLFISGESEQFNGIFSKLDKEGVNREIIPTLDTSKKILTHLKKLVCTIKKFAPEIIHTQTNYQLLLAALLKPFFNFKIIHTIHAFNNGKRGFKMHIAKLYLTTACLTSANRVIFQSSFVKCNFKLLLHKSCDLTMGFEVPEQPKTLKCHPPYQIIYAAKFHEAKNHKWLIEALEPLLYENLVHLTIPGNGDTFQEVQQLIIKKGLSSQVHLPGWVGRTDMNSIYAKSHLAIVPSKSETLGHNIIEPLAFGVPVISFPVGIAPDIAKKCKAVTLLDFYDSSQLVRLVRKITSNIEQLQNTSHEAKQYFYENLTWETHISKYKKLLNEL